MHHLFANHRTEITVALKVCEACGALWLRARSHGAYCFACAHWLAEFPLPRGPRRAGWHWRRNREARSPHPVTAQQPQPATAGGAR